MMIIDLDSLYNEYLNETINEELVMGYDAFCSYILQLNYR